MNRVLFRESQSELRQQAECGINALDDHLAGRQFLCNDERPMLADILLLGFLFIMLGRAPWANNRGCKVVGAWVDRMGARPTRESARNAFFGTVQISSIIRSY